MDLNDLKDDRCDSTYSWCRFIIGNRGPTTVYLMGRWGKEEWVSGLLSIETLLKPSNYTEINVW